MQETQPAWILSFPVVLFLGLMFFIALRVVSHRRGATLVVAICSLFVGLGLLYFLTARLQVAYQPPPPPPQPIESRRAARDETLPLIPLDTDRPVTAEPPTPAAPKPAWVGQPLETVDGVSTFSVVAGPHQTEEVCRAELTDVLRKAVDAYIDQYIGVPGAGRRVDLQMNYIRDHLVKDRYFEPVQFSLAPMLNLHVQVQIDPKTHDLIRREHQQALVQARLGYAGGAFGLVLILLGTAFSYLKLDTATKGFYSGRLKLAATAVILTAAAATALVVRQADPAAEWPVGFPTRETSQLDF